ncbi:MAG: right-handed parallel beta-helix repeat-containing protein, partial [Ignavibacteriae bacterium]|nr:right-handed parallel beta-helix repeat-containing protein [Ignavibacteriota bacterium]
MNGNITNKYENNSILELSFIVNNTLSSGDASPLTIKRTDLIDVSLSKIYLSSITDGVFVVNLGSQEGHYVFVDINSTKAQNGTRNNPFSSVQNAIDFSSPGDTIIVAPGEYFGPFTMKDSTFLKGSGASVTELNLDFDLYFGIPVVSFNSIKHSKISGFTIHSGEVMESASIYCDNSSPTITENYFIAPFINADATALFCNNQSNPLLQRNTTENCKVIIFNSHPNIKNNSLRSAAGGMSSLDISENSSPMVSQNTICTSMGGGAGISIFNSSPIIENNIIISQDQNGQGLYISNSDSCMVRNNIILDANEDGIGLAIQNSTNINIYNNTISTKQSGVWSTASSGYIYNNIITNNKLFGIQTPGFSFIDYNCLWNNSTNYENTTSGNNDIFLDPLFENININLFELVETSPCINAGNPSLEFNDSDKSRNDIGAYGGPYADLDWIEYENSKLEIINDNVHLYDTIYVTINGSNIS